jgi:23S rRNA pseudouridine2605 synthase
MKTEKLQKVLARAGLGSRREMEIWISDGKVTVNRKVATLGDRVCPEDVIRIGKRRLTWPKESRIPQVICYHKPVGEICTRKDPQGRPTIFTKLPKLKGARWVSVGRLDINTAGLILLTDSGELANQLMHPAQEVEREYAVRVLGEISAGKLQKLQQGIMLDDGLAKFERLLEAGGEGANHWYHVVLREGRNREVRRMWEAVEVQVSRLIRIRYGPIQLPPGLKQGNSLPLTSGQVKELMRLTETP